MKKIVSALLLMLGIGVVGTLVSVSASGGFSFETYEIKDEIVIENKEIDDLNFHFASSDIEVIPTTDENIRVELEGRISRKLKEKLSLVAKEDGNQVDVTLHDNNQKILNIGIQIYDTNIRIHVPKKEYNSITIATASGDIGTEGILAKKLTVKANSGDIRVESSEGRESFDVITSSGDITVEQAKSEKIALASSSGDVYLKGSQATNTSTVASSGDVVLSKASGNIETITSSGDISLSNQQPTGDIIAKSSSGDVIIEFKEKPTSLELDYKGESGTGMIELKGVSFQEKEEDRIIGQIGDGKYRLNVKTNSGDFYLK
jgi:lia operon protein LiaG